MVQHLKKIKKWRIKILVQIISTSCNRRDLELEQIRLFLVANGHSLSMIDFDTDPNADAIILSTCGFTQAAEDFGVKTLLRIIQEKKNTCRVYVGGCLPKINPSVVDGYDCFDPCSYEKLNTFFNAEIPFESFKRPNLLANWSIHSFYKEHGMTDAPQRFSQISAETHKDNLQSVKAITNILRANDKQSFRIQCLVGCSCKCSYCAIKFAIGPIKSRTIDDIMEDVEVAISGGFRNILLEGDSLGGYGIDIGTNIGELLEKIYERIIDTELTINLPDVSPAYLKVCSGQIIKLVQAKKLYSLYIPIQSGSQKILNKMRRGYNIDDVISTLNTLRDECPELHIGTSVIVGFPGETEEDFKATINACKQVKFDFVHVHSYSDRKNTESFDMKDKVSSRTILSRSRRFKKALHIDTPIITIAEDTKGNRTCQG